MEETTRIPVIRGGDNVFADLGFDNPDEELAKADLALEIGKAISARGLALEGAARLVNLPEDELSKILVGRTEGCSIDLLISLLNLLGQDVEIRVRPAAYERSAHLSVATAS